MHIGLCKFKNMTGRKTLAERFQEFNVIIAIVIHSIREKIAYIYSSIC